MADTKVETRAPKSRRWLRRLGWIAGTLVVLVVALYFIATSKPFVKGVVLPRVGHAMNAEISVADAEVSPFKKITLRDVKITPKGAEPLFTATEVRLRYSLLSIIGGKIVVEEMTVIAPTVTIVENADGTSNLDPLLKKKKPEKKKRPPSTKPGSPPVVDVKSVMLSNATIRRVTNLKGGGRDVLELANVNITASNIKNGQAGKLDLAATLSMENAAKAASAGGSLHATLKGGFNFNLAKNLLPTSLKGDTTFTVEKATGELSDLGTLTAKLDCDKTATEIKQLALRFTKANASLGELRLSGPFDSAKVEGKLKLEILPLDRQVLNLAGAASGLDFGTTTIKSSSEVELTKGGSVISLAGNVDVARFQVIRQKQTSPTLDLRCDYNVTVNRDEQTATLKTINLAGTQNKRPFLQAKLTSPMTIARGKANGAAGDATLNLAVTSLDLADWRAFAPEAAPEGKVNAKLKLLSQQGGSHLTFEIESQVENFSARFGSNQVDRAELRLVVHGQSPDLKQKKFKLDDYRLELAQQGQAALTVSGSGTFDGVKQDADLQVVVQATLARLLALLPQPDAKITAGTIDFKGHVTSKKENQKLAGELVLADLTGHYGTYRFANFGTWLNFDVAMKGNAVEIRKTSGHVRESQNMGGQFEVTGNFDRDRKTGQFKLKLTDFNQNGLRPFLESALGGKKLVSVALNSTASANFGANGDASVKTDMQLANLVVSDPKGGSPATPLEARVQVDTTVAKKIAQVRQCQLTLTPTDRAKNQLGLTGTVDFSKTNTTGNLKLAAESLDLTRYYDLFADKPTATATKPGAPAPNPPLTPPGRGSDSDKEPDPIKLKFQNFTCDVNIGRLRLREVDITKLQTTALLNGGHILLKPCQLTLNGAPINATADLDLSVPGYRYDVTFSAQAVPLAPLVNSFQPERKGQIGGHVTASAQLKGEGTTGASLQKNLSGQFNVLATNLNLAIGNVRSPVLKTVINVVVAIPDLIRNPTGAVGNLLGRITGLGGASKGGWLDELTSAPINVVLLNGNAGEGHIRLQQAEVRSSAFQAQANGDIAIAPILTNSTINIPVNIALSRALSDRLGLGSADTNAVYVALPQLLKLKGTVGKPKEDINTLALVTLAAKAGGGLAKQLGSTTGSQVGGILDAVGGLLGGKTAPATGASTNAPSAAVTNAPAATNAPPTNRAINLLDLFKKPKKE